MPAKSIYPALRRALGAAALFLCSAIAWGQATDEFLGLSDEQLAAVQHDLLEHYTQGKALADPVLQQYVHNLNGSLESGERRLVSFVDDERLNAFAAWGNIIVLNSGILAFTTSEDELAGVLAHEHAHLDRKHFFRLPKTSSLIRDISAAGFLIAVLAGNPDMANVFAGTSGLAQNQELAALREFESEADQQAVRELVRAGYDPEQFSNLLDRMGSSTNVALPEYLSTHPHSENRASDLNTLIRTLRPGSKSRSRSDQLDFWLARTRALATTGGKDKAQPPEAIAGTVMSYDTLIKGGPKAAAASESLAGHADNWIVALGIADHHLATDNPDLAREALRGAMRADPGNFALLAKDLQLLGLLGKRKEAVKTLAKISTGARNNRFVAEAESRLWERLGDTFNYRLAVGFEHYLSGNLGAARDQVARLREIEGESVSGSSRGRLALLESKIESLEDILEQP